MSNLLLGTVVFVFYKLLSVTWRLKISEPESMKTQLASRMPMILAHWHGDELALVCLARRYRIATIVSTSRDGSLMNVVLRLLGGRSSRGSSTRGGSSALKGLLRIVKTGYNCSFAVDGPKGPRFEVKPGVFEMSRLMKCPIFVGGLECHSAWRFEKSWNKTYLPKPFAKIILTWSGPIGPIDKEIDPRSLELAASLGEALRQAGAESSKKFDQPNLGC